MARGIAFGRPSKLREDQKEVVRDLVKNGLSSDTAYESQRHCPLIPAFFLEGGEI